MILDILLLVAGLFITVSIIYSTVKLGISPMPSSKKAYNAIVTLIDNTGTGPIIDLGSGWGNFVVRMAKRNPQRQIVGYELSILPWITSVLLKKTLGLNNLTLYRKNFYDANLSNASVLICYLYPEAMNKINNKLIVENPNVGFLISNNFALPSWQPKQTLLLDDFYKSPIYLYDIKHGHEVEEK